MTLITAPWLELAIATPLIGAVVLTRIRDPQAASRWCLGFSSASVAFTAAACLAYARGEPSDDLLARVFGRSIFTLDALSAPLVPLVALLHLLTVLATARTKMERFSFAGLLIGQSLRVGMFASAAPIELAILMILALIPPYVELRSRNRSTRVYVAHMGLFVALLVAGIVTTGTLAAVLLMFAVLVRSGTFPAHTWVPDLFEKASFGGALLFMMPITGMYAAIRLVLPLDPPDWALQSIGAASLITALYAAGLTLVQTDARRFFAYLVLSHSALVLVGMELHTSISLTGSLALWLSVMVSLGGFGLTIRALEARFGRLSLTEYRGLTTASSSLSVCFMLTGLACVGFPGTSGFVAAELLVDGAVGANLFVGLGVVAAAALNGMAVVRAYFILFTGARYMPNVHLGITSRERFAVLALTVLILGGGFFPQILVTLGHHASELALGTRH